METPKKDIRNEMHTVSNIIKAKKLIRLAIRDKLKSPPDLVNNENNKRIIRIVCTPKGIGNSLTT